MEYNIFHILRHKINIPYFIRVFFCFVLIFISLFPIILPLFPWSLFLWVFLLSIGILLLVSWKKVKHVVKIRKWIFYLAQNFHKKRIIWHKIKDIKEHVRAILNEKRKRWRRKIRRKQ